MAVLSSYLTFHGNCREAMQFYQKCLGGKLNFQTIGESPLSGNMPGRMKNCILYASLNGDGILLMASDMVGERGLLRGNAVSLMLNFTSEKDLRSCYKTLSAGGEQTHPLKDTAWGAIIGELADKYGNHWILNYNRTIIN